MWAEVTVISVTHAAGICCGPTASAVLGDRLIYTTAIEHSVGLVTKDRAIRDHDRPRSLTIW